MIAKNKFKHISDIMKHRGKEYPTHYVGRFRLQSKVSKLLD